MNHEKSEVESNPITLEDLLKLKRHETPDTAFWATFEKNLKKRTLKELVTRPSVRESIKLWFAQSGYRWILSGSAATAAIAISFTSFQVAPTLAENNQAPEQAPTDTQLAAIEDPAQPIAQTDLEISPIAPSSDWEEAKADFTVDVIVAANVSDNPQTYSTDLSTDTLAASFAEPVSYAEDVFISNIATLSPNSFRLGM